MEHQQPRDFAWPSALKFQHRFFHAYPTRSRFDFALRRQLEVLVWQREKVGIRFCIAGIKFDDQFAFVLLGFTSPPSLGRGVCFWGWLGDFFLPRTDRRGGGGFLGRLAKAKLNTDFLIPRVALFFALKPTDFSGEFRLAKWRVRSDSQRHQQDCFVVITVSRGAQRLEFFRHGPLDFSSRHALG